MFWKSGPWVTGWWLLPKIVYPPKMVTYLRNNPAVPWLGFEPVTECCESDVVTSTPPSDWLIDWFIHSFIHLFIYPFIHSLIHSFIHSFIDVKMVLCVMFRRGYVYLELSNISGGLYNIRPCTFYPNQEAPFFINISSTCPISISSVSWSHWLLTCFATKFSLIEIYYSCW